MFISIYSGIRFNVKYINVFYMFTVKFLYKHINVHFSCLLLLIFFFFSLRLTDNSSAAVHSPETG